MLNTHAFSEGLKQISKGKYHVQAEGTQKYITLNVYMQLSTQSYKIIRSFNIKLHFLQLHTAHHLSPDKTVYMSDLSGVHFLHKSNLLSNLKYLPVCISVCCSCCFSIMCRMHSFD